MCVHCINLSRNNAEEALQKLNGTTIGKQMVRLSWGRNPANKQVTSVICILNYDYLMLEVCHMLSFEWRYE